MAAPLWSEYAAIINDDLIIDYYNSSSQLARSLRELSAWSRSHQPPLTFAEQETPALPLALCRRTKTALEAGPTPLVVQLINTTAYFLHTAYLSHSSNSGTGSAEKLEPTTAVALAQQVVSSTLLGTIPQHVERAAYALEDAVDQQPGQQQQQQGPAGGSASHVQYSLALLQLLLAIYRMWPGGAMASEEAAPAAESGAKLALRLLQLGARQCSSTGIRHNVIMACSLSFTKLLTQQLRSPDSVQRTTVARAVLACPELLPLVCLQLEVQLASCLGGHIISSSQAQQQQGNISAAAVAAAAGAGAAAGSAAEDPAQQKRGAQREQQDWFCQTYMYALWQQLGYPRVVTCHQLLRRCQQLEQWWQQVQSCVPAASIADCVTTLQALENIYHRNVELLFGYRLHEYDPPEELQLVLFHPVRLLRLAADSIGRKGQQKLCLAAVSAAAAAIKIWDEIPQDDDLFIRLRNDGQFAHWQVVHLLAEVMRQVPGLPGSSSSSSSSSSDDAAHLKYTVLLHLLIATKFVSGACRTAGGLGPGVHALAAALQQCTRTEIAAAAVAETNWSLADAAVNNMLGFIGADKEPPSAFIITLLRASPSDSGCSKHVTVLDKQAQQGPDELFCMLISLLKVAALLIKIFIHEDLITTCARHASRQLELASSSGGGSSSCNCSVYDAAPWLVLWARCIAVQADGLRQLLQAAGFHESGFLQDDLVVLKLRQYALGLHLQLQHIAGSAEELAIALTHCCSQLPEKAAAAAAAVQQQSSGSSSRSARRSSSTSSSGGGPACSSSRGSSSRGSRGSNASRWSGVAAAADPAASAAYWSHLPACKEQLEQKVLPAVQQSRQFAEEALACAEKLLDSQGAKAEGRSSNSSSDSSTDHSRQQQVVVPEAVEAGVASSKAPATAAELLAAFQSSNVRELPQLLDTWTSGLCAALPLPHCCNNPSCMNLDTVSEQQLVGGTGCMCGGCKVARYCSAACQKAHWRHHKPMCRKLASAAADTAATAAVVAAAAAPIAAAAAAAAAGAR